MTRPTAAMLTSVGETAVIARAYPRVSQRRMVERLEVGGLGIAPPLLSRTYQVLSDGAACVAQARKVAYTPFPFPLRQLLALLLLVFQVRRNFVVTAVAAVTLLLRASTHSVAGSSVLTFESCHHHPIPF